VAWNVGDVYRAKTGEIVEVLAFTNDKSVFKLLNPNTMEDTNYYLEGPLKNLEGWSKAVGLKKIDRKTYVPTGLVKT
jgi:hypothetical protein